MLPTLMIGDYLFVAKWPYGYSRYSFPFGFPSFDGRVFGSLPERGDVVVFRRPGDGRGFRQAGDRPARRHDRGARRQLVLNGRPVPREQRGRRFAMPVSPNSPCRASPPRRRWSARRPTAAPAASTPLTARRCPAAAATRSSTRSKSARRRFRADRSCPPAMCS